MAIARTELAKREIRGRDNILQVKLSRIVGAK
jgi:hypothetical protein